MRRVLMISLPVVLVGVLLAAVLVGGALSDGPQSGGSSDPVTRRPAMTPTVAATATATSSPTPTATPTVTATPTPSAGEQYRAAIQARDRGDLDTAAIGLEAIANAEGMLAPYAAFRLAQVYAARGDHEAAVGAFAAALDDPALAASLRPIGREEAADSLVVLGRLEAAVDWLDLAAADPLSSLSQQLSARWKRAQLLDELADATWIDDALALVVQSPGHPSASLALDALEAAEVDAPPLSAAYTRYLARQNGLATQRYEAILDESPDAATAGVAWFYLGALAERVPDRTAAIAAYGESQDVSPFGSRADDAAYWRGRVAEEEGDFEAAAEYYATLAAEYPSSGFNADGALRGALAVLETGDEAEALARLATIADGGGSQAAAAARWYELTAGAEARIEAGVPAAAAIDPRSYASLLEAGGATVLEAPLNEPLPRAARDEGTIEDWLVTTYGVSTGTSRIDEEIVLETALILVEAGERSLARAIFVARVDVVRGDPHAVIGLSVRASELGLPDAALIAAMRILGKMTTAERLETPAALEQLAYPSPWSELLTAASEEFEVPPLLLLALIRQESAFEPDVVSPAGAIGLTQVIPPTGIQIASALDEEWGGAISLTDPETSLRYGASYLATQLESFDGNVFAALAAYNAGPTNARRWLDAQVQAGPDGFIQTIDFEETRRYVTSVIEQYGWYRYAYGAAETPAIR